MASDAAVERLVGHFRGIRDMSAWNSGADEWECDEACGDLLDALPDLLREDSAAGEALRERLGLTLDRRQRCTGCGAWAGENGLLCCSMHADDSTRKIQVEQRLTGDWKFVRDVPGPTPEEVQRVVQRYFGKSEAKP